MGDGITILNQTEIMTTPPLLEIGVVSTLIVTLLLIGIASFLEVGFKKTKLSNMFAILALLSAIICCFSMCSTIFIQKPTGNYIYDCLIDEQTPLVDFYERYEVIEVNDKIWTIKEKDGD